MEKKDGYEKSTATEPINEENMENAATRAREGKANASCHSSEAACLAKVLEEIKHFHKDIKQQLNYIKSELTNPSQKTAEAEMRIEKVEDCVLNVEQVDFRLWRITNESDHLGSVLGF